MYEVTADGFLRYMVRAIVGTLVEIGRGWRSAESMAQLIEERQARARGRDGAGARVVPCPRGLLLTNLRRTPNQSRVITVLDSPKS